MNKLIKGIAILLIALLVISMVPQGVKADDDVPDLSGLPIPTTTVTGEEVVNMDTLGKFRFPGNPNNIEYNGKKNPISRLFDGLLNLLDYIMGLLFGAIKAVFVGWAEIIESIFNGILHSVEEA